MTLILEYLIDPLWVQEDNCTSMLNGTDNNSVNFTYQAGSAPNITKLGPFFEYP